MTVNEKGGAISPILAVGFKKLFYGMQNYLDKLKMRGWSSLDITCKMNELFSPAGLASQVLLSLCEGQITRVQAASYLWVDLRTFCVFITELKMKPFLIDLSRIP